MKITIAALGVVSIHQQSAPERHRITFTDNLYVIDLRGRPRAVSLAVGGGARGACMAQDMAYGPSSAVSCDWAKTRDDFVCTEASTMNLGWTNRVAWRRWTLFGGKTLARASDISDADELLSRNGGVIAGEGTLERLALTPGVDFFFIPPTGHAFVIEGWIVDHKTSRVVPVESSDFDPEISEDDDYREINWADLADEGFTPDREKVTLHLLKPIDENITPFVLRDGSASALFWLGYDGERAALLRVATDAEEYTRCGSFRHAASATSISGTTVRVGPASNVQNDDEADVVSCPFTATVRWDHGFVVERTAAEATCGSADLVGIAIGDDGTIARRSK